MKWGYNRLVLRPAAIAIVVTLALSCALAAPRGGFAGHASGGASAHSGASAGSGFRGSANIHPLPRNRPRRNYGYFYPYSYPYDEPYYDGPYAEPEPRPAPALAPAPVVQAPIVPKLIEVPGAGNAVAAKPLPPTVFILTSGERLESSRFLVRARDLSVTVNRQARTIPLDKLDIDATVAANHERGIDLEIPADPNEVSLRF